MRDDEKTIVVDRNADNDATEVHPRPDSDATFARPPGGLEDNAHENSTPQEDHAHASGDVLANGTVLKGRFVVDRVLGHGGMGVVYRALDLRKQEAQDRDPYVALKSLSQGFQQDERMVLALQRESRKAQSLAHPNIATVYDFDREGDLVYLTMEVLAGSPMDDFIKEHPQGLPMERVAPIVRGMCLGLAYAHNKHIVHSDFKPGNVFVGEKDNPKILDFGIARATPSDTKMTESDVTMFDAGELGALTPSYASKEMFFGDTPHPADDVYALAVTVYQLLTGRHPFDSKPAPTAQADGMRPQHVPGIKRREWNAIRHGLAFDRADRQQHAADFLREFEGASKLRLISSLAVVLGIGFLAYVGFVQIQEQARIAPDLPFESLPGDQQAKIEEHLRDAQMFELGNQANAALNSYREAYAEHPRNPRVTAGMVALLEDFAAKALERDDEFALRGLRANLQQVMEIDGFLANHDELLAIQSALNEQL